MEKIMILPICLGIILLGVMIAPSAFAATYTVINLAGSNERGCEETTQGCFVPNLVTIDVGDKIIWENADIYGHNVASGNSMSTDVGSVFDSQFIDPGASFSHTFDEAGTYDYFCMVHPWMVGTVVVEAAGAADEAANATSQAALSASGGCGAGTVLVDGVCQLAPKESNVGCGEGTVMVNGVCQLAETGSSFKILDGSTIEPLYIVIGAAAIGGAVIGIVFIVRRGSSGTKRTKPARQDLEEYEEQYLRRQGQRPRRKPADTIGIVEEFARKRPRLTETSSSCNSCGKPLKPTAKFCGKCGAKQ